MKVFKLHFRLLLVLSALILKVAPQGAVAALPQVYAGSAADSSLLTDGVGTLSAWGYNGSAQLGLGHYSPQPNPSAAPFPLGVQSWRCIATARGSSGGAWTYAIGSDGRLYSAGFVSFADPYHVYMATITPPAGVGGWTSVAAGESGWLAVSTNGPIYGVVNGNVSLLPKAGAARWLNVAMLSYTTASEPDVFALDDQGRAFGFYSGTIWFSSSPTFVAMPVPAGATAWTNISAGGNFVLAQANNGHLYGWGHNESGQLGLGFGFVYTNAPQRIALPSGKAGWKSISAGGGHSMATTTDGQLFVWGYNQDGQLGLGNKGPNQYSPIAVPGLTNVSSIAAGKAHSLVIAECQALAWGKNSNGQLGIGIASPFYPAPINSQFTYDICSIIPPSLPLVSVIAGDPEASEGTWRSTPGQPATNTGRFEFSRAVATDSSLDVQFAVSGTALNGIDYVAIPSSVTIPANSNSVSLLIIPTGGTLAVDPSTVAVNLLSHSAYQFGNATNAAVTIIQYESDPGFPLPGIKLNLFVGTNLNGHVFIVQSSTNLVDWSDIGTGTNVFGVVTVTETNHVRFRQRFFRALPVP